MKPIHHFILGAIIMLLVFWGAMCETPTEHGSPCDTLTIAAGKAQQIIVRRKEIVAEVRGLEIPLVHSFIVISSADGKQVYAMKDKEGWKILDCERALEVLIADLELARQTKPK